MEERSGKIRRMELKICERCGGLWLRPAETDWSYCRPCKVQIDDLPKVRRKINQVRANAVECVS